VVGLIEPQIRKAEIERARVKRPENLDAYDLYLRALPYFYGPETDGYVTAIDLLERAVALDSGFAIGLAYAAFAYEKRETNGLPPLRPNDHQRCIELARAALREGSDDPQILAICGNILVVVAGEATVGLAAVRRAIKSNPNNVVVLNNFGISNIVAGDLDEAYAAYERAYQLSPGAPEICESLSGMGFVRLFRRDYEGAVEWLERSLTTFNEWQPTYWSLAAAYALLDRMDDARAVIARLLVLSPHSNLAWMQRLAAKSDGRYEPLIAGLRKAGLPQGRPGDLA
jgi:tetratricopeptide (TPR) repeat protein